ncbi:hypothetical protein MBLNU459_g2764t1 [Dothideomycetes sp. NU459]
MADAEDKEKAEKLAAAKKRFEQLKKQQKGKKGGKKKEDKAAEDAAEEKGAPDEAAPDEEAQAAEPGEPETARAEAADPADATHAAPSHARRPSVALQSRQRSESFRQGSSSHPISPGLSKSPGLPSISAEGEVQDVYRKQTARIEELERENKTLRETQGEDSARLQRTEEALERLREGSADVAELKARAALADEREKETDRLKAELASVQRQLAQAQQAAANSTNNRRKSNASPTRELSEQLSLKTSTIESLELELSNLRNQYNMSLATVSTHEATITDLEQRAATAEAAESAAKQETATLKESLSQTPAENDRTEDEDPVALQKKITLLESDLRTAQSSADSASQRATSLEQKIEALTKLHKDSTTATLSREKEIKDLKTRITTLERAPKAKPREDGEDETLSDLEDEERETLHSRIRHLEAENFDLRRGVWREKRQALQPDLTADGGDISPGYEDIDLNSSQNPYAQTRPLPGSRGTSTFQDVLQSGLNAFTGRDTQRRSADHGQQDVQGRARGQSLGLLSEEGFDEDAFRLAQEDEAKKRIERIREVKRGLEQWRGWKVDIADMRGGGLGGGAATGPVFEV